MVVRIIKSANLRVWTIVIERPEVRNAVDGPTATALHQTFLSFENDTKANVAILYGKGGNFCSGADLKALSYRSEHDDGQSNIVTEPSTLDRFEIGPMGPTRLRLSKPSIAAIEGYAVAGGLELAIWADLRVVSEDATFGVFCRRWGVPLIDGGTIRLPRLIGQSRALDMILTGRPVLAQEAYDIGLANRIVPKGSTLKEAMKIAELISSFPQQCMRSDRISTLQQWNCHEINNDNEGYALKNEYDHGKDVLKEAIIGASKFRDGAGRAGSFDEFRK